MTDAIATTIANLKRNIELAEGRAQRALEQGNDFAHESHTDFADECRAELRRLAA